MEMVQEITVHLKIHTSQRLFVVKYLEDQDKIREWIRGAISIKD